MPDHYVWTPSGYVFVDGYYDYSVPRRGVVFAPVYFNGRFRTQRGFSYSPSTVINPGVFLSHLFLRPGYGHYYFGDYYGSNYAAAGFSPWFTFQSSRRGYDPIYANQRWQHRRDHGWEQRAEANFRNLRDNKNDRPPHNWTAQRTLAGRADSADRGNFAVATPLEELAQRKDGRLRFQPVNPVERQQFGQRGQEYRKYLQQRQQLEANAPRTSGGDPTTAAGSVRRTFSRSPFASLPVDQLGRDYAPPQRHEVLKPDFQVQPQPRTRGQAEPQRQRLNQGNRQGVSNGQQQGASGGHQQGASDGKQQGGGSQQQGASGGQQQGASGGQQQGASRRPTARWRRPTAEFIAKQA